MSESYGAATIPAEKLKAKNVITKNIVVLRSPLLVSIFLSTKA